MSEKKEFLPTKDSGEYVFWGDVVASIGRGNPFGEAEIERQVKAIMWICRTTDSLAQRETLIRRELQK